MRLGGCAMDSRTKLNKVLIILHDILQDNNLSETEKQSVRLAERRLDNVFRQLSKKNSKNG